MVHLVSDSASSEAKPGAERQRYFIDPGWYERNGRLFSAFVESRMCPSCQRKLEAERGAREEPAPTKTRSRKANRRPPADPVTTIQSCCSKGDFITPKLPALEAVFRLLLVKGSPMDAVQIRESLDSWPGVTGAYSHISVEMFERLLEGDSYYGFQPFRPKDEGQ